MIPFLRHTKPQPRTVVRLFFISGFLLLLGLLFLQFIETPTPDPAGATQSQKINLALRRTAHHLLRAAGDSTSRIPPVQQTAPQIYHVQLDHAFDYDQLPRLLQASLKAHRITDPYDVAVLDCTQKQLQLGYTHTDLTDKKTVPCGGRSMTAGCYILQVTFTGPNQPQQTVAGSSTWPVMALGSILIAGLLFVNWNRTTRKTALVSSPDPAGQAQNPNALRFGQSCLDVANQVLTTGPTSHNLTYRETKLLRVLVNHANQVMERDRILQLVWEDEGVTVGRSVDVFVSRLRKLLSEDTTVRIASVHGVGYRLEIAS